MDRTEQLLKRLTEASGVPGFEAEVRALIRGELEGIAAIEQDRMGSIVCRKDGTQPSPKIMLAAHMDEIGFMVKQITKEGHLRFVPLGGWWEQVMLAQRVIVKTAKGDIPGVMGAKPPHILTPEERNKVVDKRDMYIDIGATSREEAEQAGVRPGDPVVPVSAFTPLAGGKTYLAKAWDDRVGCALFVQALQRLASEEHPNTVYGVGTVQEEVGLRGAKTTAYVVNPDVAIILESDIAYDVPGMKQDEPPMVLGKGPSLVVFDAGMIPNTRLRDLTVETAAALGIPLQFSSLEGGRTDGSIIHLHNAGVPTIVLGVAARHIHSHAGIIHRGDYDHLLDLLVALVKRLDAATVDALVQ
ncbi:MAG: M42 family metallopeptidase [Chloroflexi bacterium]|nr:M42 family metallopeptidase [Chloroflexota bacterium]